MIAKAIEFFISTWLWADTWGIYHITLNIIFMLILLKFVGKFKIVPSVLLAFFSEVFAILVYTVSVFFLVFEFGLKYTPEGNADNVQVINVLLACISVGVIYSFLQSLFFFIVNKFYSMNLRMAILVAFVSNIIAALFIYRFLDIN